MPLDAWKHHELGRRVAALESAAKKPPPPPPKKGAWDLAALLMPLMNGVAIALVGWWLTGAVELALKRDTLQLAQVKEMQALITGLTSDKLDAETALPTALTLAAYGKPAVPPLLALLTERFDEVRGPAAESALRAIGMANREAVCEPLVVLAKARAGRLSWPVHATVIRLIGDSQCDKAAAQLRAIDRRLESTEVAALAAEYDSRPVFDRNSVLELRKTIAASLRSLEPAR
jgi:hypothetical protein